MKSVLVAGYRATDIGIFSESDPRIAVIKKAIQRDLIRLLDQGVEWLIFTGNLGFEYWVLEEARLLQEEYGFQLATIFPFETHGEQWNEVNRLKLAQFQSVDFVKYAYPRYESPSQFRGYNQFLIDNTEMGYLFYDVENETNLKYLYDTMKMKEDYTVKTLTFSELNEVAEKFEEK